MKLYTNKGKSLSFGNKKSVALKQTVAPPAGGWLAALKGEHDLVEQDGKQVGRRSYVEWAVFLSLLSHRSGSSLGRMCMS
jgi:hypothetical protein